MKYKRKGANVVDAKEMQLIKGWEAEAELIIHSSWVKMFRDKFTESTKNNVQSNKTKIKTWKINLFLKSSLN